MAEIDQGENGSRATNSLPSKITSAPVSTGPAAPRTSPAGTTPPINAEAVEPAETATEKPSAPAVVKPLVASLHSHGDKAANLCQLVKQLEEALGVPVWMCVQSEGTGQWSSMTSVLAGALRGALSGVENPRLAVLVHSPGGQATCAYQLGTAFAKRPEGFWCVVPRYAKSAATLMALGASKIIMGRVAELGPLDAQILDTDREEFMSALDEVQSLERLQKFALDALDATMNFLVSRTLKKTDSILPMATQFVHGMVQPMFAGIDVVHYTKLSRTLKVAEEYAVRLMEPRLGREKAVDIATHLTSAYPEHGFVIDCQEIQEIGLDAEEATGPVAEILDAMTPFLGHVSAIGQVTTNP